MNNQSFVRVEPDDHHVVAQAISRQLLAALNANRSVVWLVSGGSCIPIAVQARELLGQLDELAHLSVIVMDERYGEIDHAGSNSMQLKKAGFDMRGLHYYEVLQGESIEKTTVQFAQTLETLQENEAVVIGLFGMGADGHTSGLLPGNPVMDSTAFTGFFDGHDYPRITTTPAFIRGITEATLYAVGESKWPALSQMQQPGPVEDLPVRTLRGCSRLTIFSDINDMEEAR